jgi:hypothetical protein
MEYQNIFELSYVSTSPTEPEQDQLGLQPRTKTLQMLHLQTLQPGTQTLQMLHLQTLASLPL